MINRFVFLLACIIAFGCHSDKSFHFDNLKTKYKQNPKDSLKLEALIFLEDNMDGITSKQSFFSNINGTEVDLNLDTIYTDNQLRMVIDKYNLSLGTRLKDEVQVLSMDFLDKHISSAIADWNKHAWAKDIPKEMFLNYILP
jgi:hypothetical protein